MSLVSRSLISLDNWSLDEVNALFSQANNFKVNPVCKTNGNEGRVVALAFFEPSTRTKLSFQTALSRLGLKHVDLGSLSDSSMVKGESFFETLKSIEAMEPDLLILRTNTKAGELDDLKGFGRPMISAGCGPLGHPTQALADAMTIAEHKPLQDLIQSLLLL